MEFCGSHKIKPKIIGYEYFYEALYRDAENLLQ